MSVPKEQKSASVALHLRDVSVSYGARTALDGVSFDIQSNRFTALLGPNGAGKSTLFSVLTHLILPDRGFVSVLGLDLLKEPRLALARMGIVFQQSTHDPDLTVRRNLRYFAALHGISGRESRVAIERALDRLGMLERADEVVRDLNGGHRRRLEIARALVHDPALLLLDEPTVGLDAASRSAITKHVHALTEEKGLAVLWATHLVDEIRHGDDVVILHRGKVLETGIARDIADGESLSDRFLAMTGDRE